jgi:hypothetical protein
MPETSTHSDTRIEHLASRMYTSYCEGVGGQAHNGQTLPAWEEFSKDENKTKQANAWRKAAGDTLIEMLAFDTAKIN